MRKKQQKKAVIKSEIGSIRIEIIKYIKYLIESKIINEKNKEFIEIIIGQRTYIKEDENAIIWIQKHKTNIIELKNRINEYEIKNGYKPTEKKSINRIIQSIIHIEAENIIKILNRELGKRNTLKELIEELEIISKIKVSREEEEEEIYKTIPEYPEYKISNKANVIKRNNKRKIKTEISRKGYVRIWIYKEGEKIREYVNYLMANTYLKHKRCEGIKVKNITWNRQENNIENIKLEIQTKRKAKRNNNK